MMDGLHGSDLTPVDVPALNADLDRVRELMLDGQWRTIPDIARATGIDMDASVSRYLRYLRDPKHGGYAVDKQRLPGALRLWEYRVTPGDGSAAALTAFKEEHPEIPWSAKLGCATTRQLLAEVSTRMRIGQNSINGRRLADLCDEAASEKGLAPHILDYKTSEFCK